jgi:type IV pilus assembly protein PilV
MPFPRPNRDTGFSLIELSVATAVYSLGLGSLSLMLMLAVRGTTEARFETAATIQAASLAEMILMNSDAAGHYALASPPTTAGCGPGDVCSIEEMAAWQLSIWRHRLATELPGGSGIVCRDSTPDDGNTEDSACDGQGGDVIKVFWRLPATDSDADPVSARRVVRLP